MEALDKLVDQFLQAADAAVLELVDGVPLHSERAGDLFRFLAVDGHAGEDLLRLGMPNRLL